MLPLLINLCRSLAIAFALLIAHSCNTEPVVSAPVCRIVTAVTSTRCDDAPLSGSVRQIVAFGDSLTEGVRVGERYTDYLQRELDARGYRYRVVNEGVGGMTTADGIMHVQAVLAHNPDIVILELGGNDALNGVPVPAIHRNLEAIVLSLRRHASVLLAAVDVPPNFGTTYVHAFERMYRLLADYHRLPVVWVYESVDVGDGMIESDGIHLTSRGNARLAGMAFRALEPLLRK